MRHSKVIAFILLVVIALGAGIIQAKTAFTIGGSYWLGTIEDDFFGDNISKSSNMLGPYLKIRMNRLTIGGSMFLGTYDLADEFDIADLVLKLKRSDLNFSVGYSLSRMVSIFGAYKSLTWTMEAGQKGFTDEEDEDCTFTGGGISLMLPLTGSPFFLFGSGAYLMPSDEDWENIFSWNAGIGFFDKSGFSIMVGYRSESFLADEEELADAALEITGIMATVAYTIRQK
jgi:hypothetical protein